MDLIHLLNTDSLWLLSVTGLFSLLIGSFLNVVIHRLPIMMEREWKQDCQELLSQTQTPDEQQTAFNLVVPRSTCPHCDHAITALENVPVISYLFLRGKCRQCRTPISIQYPLVEVATALLSVLVAWKFGFSWQLLFALIFTWTLISLFMIDAKTMLLPDTLTLPLLWLGILANYHNLFTDLQSSVLGAMIGYMSLWTIFQLFKLVTGKDGMGFGDFKLLAALGAWGGWQILPFVIFGASFLGAIGGITWMLIRGKQSGTPLPFGPWLATTGWIALLGYQIIVPYTLTYLFPY